MATALDSTILRRACATADRILSGVSEEQLGNSTPCSKWTVADVIRHIVGAADFFADLAEHGRSSEEPERPEHELAELVPAFRSQSERLVAGFAAPGAMARLMLLPTGPAAGELTIQVAIGEILVHSWDVAKGTRQSLGDDDIADALLLSDFIALAADVRDDESKPFAAIVRYSVKDPPMDQLVAFLGRNPHWEPPAGPQAAD